MIDNIAVLRLINVTISLLSIPPSLFLFKEASKEGLVIHPKLRIVNEILKRLFLFFAIGSLMNALLSFMLFIGITFDGQFLSQSLFNIRNLVINTMISTTSWGFWVVVKRQRMKG